MYHAQDALTLTLPLSYMMARNSPPWWPATDSFKYLGMVCDRHKSEYCSWCTAMSIHSWYFPQTVHTRAWLYQQVTRPHVAP